MSESLTYAALKKLYKLGSLDINKECSCEGTCSPPCRLVWNFKCATVFFFTANPDCRDLDQWCICFGTRCFGFVVFNLLTLQCDPFSHADLHTNRRPLHGLHTNESFGTALFGQWKSRVDRGYHGGEDIWFFYLGVAKIISHERGWWMSEVVFLPRRMSMIKRTWGELGLRLSLIKFKKCALLTSSKTRRRSKTKQ